MFSLKKFTTVSTLSLLFSSFTITHACPAYYEEVPIVNPKGQTVFRAHFYNNGSRLFSSDDKSLIREGLEYWGRILQKPSQGTTPIIALKTVSNGHASYDGNRNLLKSFLGDRSRLTEDGIIFIGNSDKFSHHLGPRSHHVPLLDKMDLRTVVIHELGHGLFDQKNPNFQRFFDRKLNAFGGVKAHNVNEVLETNHPGAKLKKIPMHGDRSHIDLERSLMGHHTYRNYSIFMEAELALLQEVGWTIDRRNFFGYSLYRDGQTIINEKGYFGRNPEGTAYILGTYNQEPDGVGLHVYGSRNHVTQKADLLTEGTRAVGARIDGVDNTLLINQGTKVHANGSDGIGILFAHGKGHTFVLQGEVEAKGERGIGLSFDFGGNVIGRTIEEQGSHLWTLWGRDPFKFGDESEAFSSNALAKSVAIKGTLTGTQKAIYMSKSGLVQKIILTPQARVKGDIVSEYSQKDSLGIPYLTSLVFGHEDEKDTMEGQKFIYSHNLQGKNLDVQFTGPYTALYGGQHQLYRATVAPGATLAGNSTFKFESQTGLTNAGILSPSRAEIETSTEGGDIGTMVIDGNFNQTNTGKLVIDISKKGESDLLHVTQKAHLHGTLEVRPERGFYPNAWSQKNAFIKADEGIEGDFSQKIVPLSPTLRWNVFKKVQRDEAKSRKSYSASTDDHEISRTAETLDVSRQLNAYSQYATNGNEQSVGRVLDRVVDKADKPLQNLYEALDFSAPDGSEIHSALGQLSPTAYAGAFLVSLKREQQISDMLNQRPSVSLTSGQWQAFAFPFVSQITSKGDKLQVGTRMRSTGLIAGIEHHTLGLTWGGHVVVGNKASLTVETADKARGSLQAWGIGMNLRYQLHPLAGPYLSAQARVGLEQGTLTRTLAVNAYKGEQKGHWQGVTATASVLGGTLWRVHDHLSLGPILGLDYTLLTRPMMREKGPSGMSIALEKASYHSLQFNLGVRGVVSVNKKLKIDLQARWDRELLNPIFTQRSRFANIGDSAFITKAHLVLPNALNVSGQANYEFSPTVTLGARGSAQFFRSQKPDLGANLSLSVKF